eukprot:TRINITY_DN19942_c0_g2_i3.p1 TRINITY_DN19942_c0_g2~~TRINITY_DN19942_c0_g2_i3.p1  ORF type:complete len:604 (+),score=111.40 TRINITY_DN19942_c0_g2_i3:450-2261(+)
MKSLWKLVVTDPAQMLIIRFTEIAIHLCDSIESSVTRIRETGCLASIEFLKTADSARLVDHFNRLWKGCFHLLDDVDTSIRISGIALGQGLISLSEKLLTMPDERGLIGNCLDELLNLLLDRGVSHPSKEIQAVSMACIMALTKKKSLLMLPHLPNVIGLLLDAFSATESAELSYAMNHAEALKTTKEQIESMKIMLAENSPLASALRNCTDMIQPTLLQQTISRLSESIKFSSGIGTLYQAAKFVKDMASKYPVDMGGQVKLLFGVFQPLAFSDSAAVRKIVASTLGSLCSIANEKNVIEFLQSIEDQYLSVHLSNSEEITGDIARELVKSVKYPSEVFLSKIIPLTFVASCDSREKPAQIWSEVWNEISSGSSVEDRLMQVLHVILRFLSEGSYDLREVASSAICKVYRTSQNGDLLGAESGRILQSLILAFGRKDREGKQKIYAAVLEVMKRTALIHRENAQLLTTITEEFLKDASSSSNQIEALYNIASLCSVFPLIRHLRFTEIKASFDLAFRNSLAKLSPDKDDLKNEDDAENEVNAVKIKRVVRLCETLEQLWPSIASKVTWNCSKHILTQPAQCFSVEVEVFTTWFDVRYFGHFH